MWLLVLSSLAYALDIQPWFLPNEDKRKELTAQYLQVHYTGQLSGNVDQDVLMKPRVIVVHWTASGTAKSAWNTFSSATLAGRKDIQKAGALNVSAHFLVDRDGTIYQLLDENRVARHCIGLNHISIGIENVGGGKKYPLTVAQLEANEQLIRYLTERHEITHVIGHYEYRSLEGHPYFSERDDQYRTIKPDPEKEFMLQVHQRISDLNLQGQSKSSNKE